MRFPTTHLLALSLGLWPCLASADVLPCRQDASAGDRPRIGLVLGGGGARGFAHVSVLKELERLHVPVDCIAGTSAGSMVGGLYASGMTAAELETIGQLGGLDEGARRFAGATGAFVPAQAR